MSDMTEYHHPPTILSDLAEVIQEVRDHQARSHDLYGTDDEDQLAVDLDLWDAVAKIAARYGDV